MKNCANSVGRLVRTVLERDRQGCKFSLMLWDRRQLNRVVRMLRFTGCSVEPHPYEPMLNVTLPDKDKRFA